MENLISVLNRGTKVFSEEGIESPRLTTELLLCYVLKCNRVDLYKSYDKPLSKSELDLLSSLIERRLRYEPLQYIIGEAEFMGLKFYVDRRVFIPRPETELLVEHAINLVREKSDFLRILDIGTGCGNISISLARFLPNVIIDAIDISEDALEVASYNINMHKLAGRINLKHVNFLQYCEQPVPYDIIVSNPPYISRDEFRLLSPEIRDYEPRIATTDEQDGLTFYRAIAEYGSRLLVKNGWICVEIGFNQAQSVQEIFGTKYQRFSVINDYNNIKRIFTAQMKGNYESSYSKG